MPDPNCSCHLALPNGPVINCSVHGVIVPNGPKVAPKIPWGAVKPAPDAKPPRPLDDLTRDLRARTTSAHWTRDVRLTSLIVEAADAIARLRALAEDPKPSPESPHEFFHRAWGWAKDHPELAPYDKYKWGYVQFWLDRLREDDAKQERREPPAPPPSGPTAWTFATAFEQLEKCGFRAEGGPLENNVAYRWLRREAATSTIKLALDALRPILLAHVLSCELHAGPFLRRCECGEKLRDRAAWIDHVLGLLAFGAEPPAAWSKPNYEAARIVPSDKPIKAFASLRENAQALDAASMRCDACGATGTLGDCCRCDSEESLPRDGATIVGVESSRWPVLRNGWPVLSIERVPGNFKVVAKGPQGVFDCVVGPLGKYASNRDYDVINFDPPATIAFYDVDHARRAIYEAAVGARLADAIVDPKPLTPEAERDAERFVDHVRAFFSKEAGK